MILRERQFYSKRPFQFMTELKSKCISEQFLSPSNLFDSVSTPASDPHTNSPKFTGVPFNLA